MEKLNQTIRSCKKCRLYTSRTHAVPGEGNENAEVLIIAEAPGASEDKQGCPFAGRAGKKLDEALKSIKLSREDVFITNILKCRPPNNRDPQKEEIEACWDYLRMQIEMIQPEIIVPLGKYASQTILKVDSPMKSLRGKLHSIPIKDKQGQDVWIKVFPIYHPAHVLYKREVEKTFFEDFEMLYNLT